MYRYISINHNSNHNSLNVNKKPQKTKPISLLSGGNSFFIKVKSNQIATNYNDKSIKSKQNAYQKISSNTYFQKESKGKTLKKYLNNSQPKVSFLFTVNNSLDYLNQNNIYKSLINKTKPEINTHTKGIYSFTSLPNKGKQNNKSINSSSMMTNYNEVLVTGIGNVRVNSNKISTIREKSKETKKNTKEKNEKTINNNIINDYRTNQIKTLNPKSIIAKTFPVDLLNKKIIKKPEKNAITTITNTNNNSNQIKLLKKNNYITKNINNKEGIRYKNISNILFNTNSINEKNKKDINDKNNNYSEGKNRVIANGHRRNIKLANYKQLKINESNNNTNTFDINEIDEMDELNGQKSKRKIEKIIKTINIKPNNENLRIKNNNIIKSNIDKVINNNLILFQKNNTQENNKNNNRHINTKSNNIINKKPKLDNLLKENKLNFNYNLTDLTNFNTSNNRKQGNMNIIEDNNKSINKVIEINNQKENIYKNKNVLSGVTSINNNKIIKNNNHPSIIINNNYLYNYIPFITLNNTLNNERINRSIFNRNSFIGNNHNLNISQNIRGDKLVNYSTIDEIIINKENKNRITKKNKNEQEQIKVNILDINYNANNNNNSFNNNYYLQAKLTNTKTLDNNSNRSRMNRNNLNFISLNENINNITNNYISKEKNRKKKQNPPLNKNPKKLNILSIIQENNRKMKNYNIGRKPNFSGPLDNERTYNNKNLYVTIDNILYPESDDLNSSKEMFDNFDDMNAIVKKINFDNVDVKKSNIFTVENKYTNNNSWFEKFSENFNSMFDKRFSNNKQNMSAAQNKIKKTNYIYNSRQSGSTKASNKENSSIKRMKVSSYIGRRFERKSSIKENKN